MEESITHYLLGRASPDERAAVEQRLFSEPEFLESVRIAEEELIRDELAGELSADQRIAFHAYFLSFPHLRAKYEVTRALREALPPAPPLTRSGEKSYVSKKGPALLAMAACAAFFVAGVDDFRRWSVTRGEGAAIHAPGVLSFTLEPGLVRSGDARQTRFEVPPGAGLVRLKLEFERSDRHAAYQVSLRTADSERELFRMSGLGAARRCGAEHGAGCSDVGSWRE